MTERPILFSTAMVQAILRAENPKTQTRRVIKPDWWRCLDPDDRGDRAKAIRQCPFGKVGNKLWVRETWATHPLRRTAEPGCQIFYRADPVNESHFSWRPSIHMPRWAARITLEITRVRIQRLQDITVSDVIAEGIPPGAFVSLWDSLNAKRGFGFDTSPWVWVVNFKRIQP